MDLSTQLYFFWILVLANGYILPGFGPSGHRDPGPPDILDPLHLNPRRGPFDHHPPGPGLYGHHHRDHGMLEDFVNPLFGDSDDRNEVRNNYRATDNEPLRVNLIPEAQKNKTVHEKHIGENLEKKENVNTTGNSNNQPVKNVVAIPPEDDQTLRPHEDKNVTPLTLAAKDDPIPRPLEDKKVIPPTLAAKEEQIINPHEDKNVMPLTLPLKVEQILRTNENKNVTPKPIGNQILKSNDNAIMPVKLNVSRENSHSGDSIIFPDSVDEVKSKFKDVNNNSNKTCNLDSKNDDPNGTDKINITKNRDGVFIPVQAVPVNPVQDTDGKFLLVPINPNGNAQNQALPITNDVFPNRSPVYTTVRPGPFYTNVVNAVPLNVQPSGTWNNGNNNYYPNPSPGVPQNQSYNSGVNNPNGNNWNANVGTFNPNPSSNIGNGQVSSNPVGIPTTMFNPTSQQQPTINGYNIQPNYNNQQENRYPTRNLQTNGYNQQTVPSGVVPTYNNIQGSGPQGVFNQNTVPNYNGNSGQTYTPTNVGPNNNVQSNPNGQQFYIIPNGNQLNNNNIGQPIVLNSQGNAINPNSGNNNQQYMILNANQLNIPQNGQGNNNIYTLPNGQLVALIPVQLSNGGLVNNAVNQMTPVNGNVVQPIGLPNTVNSQPNLVPMNNNPSQPNVILMNGNTPNGAVILNGQTTNLNGQNSQPSGPIILNGQNVLGSGQPPLVNNGQGLYTMVIVPNNYANNVGANSYQVPTSSVNLVNTRDKEGKEDSSAADNSA